MGGRCRHQVQADDLGAGQQLLQRHGDSAMLGRTRRGHARAPGNHLHAQRKAHARHACANFTQAYQPERLPLQYTGQRQCCVGAPLALAQQGCLLF